MKTKRTSVLTLVAILILLGLARAGIRQVLKPGMFASRSYTSPVRFGR
jgi:hypothetical protein